MRSIRRGKHPAPATFCRSFLFIGQPRRRRCPDSCERPCAGAVRRGRAPNPRPATSTLRARRDVLDKAPRTDAQLLGHPHRLVRQPAAPLRFGPELLLVSLLQLHAHQLLPNYPTIAHGMTAGPLSREGRDVSSNSVSAASAAAGGGWLLRREQAQHALTALAGLTEADLTDLTI